MQLIDMVTALNRRRRTRKSRREERWTQLSKHQLSKPLALNVINHSRKDTSRELWLVSFEKTSLYYTTSTSLFPRASSYVQAFLIQADEDACMGK